MTKRRTYKEKALLLFAYETMMQGKTADDKYRVLNILGYSYDEYCDWFKDERVTKQFDIYFAPWLAELRGQ